MVEKARIFTIYISRYSNDQWIHHKSDKNQGENFPPFSNSQTFSNDFTLDVDEYE